MPVRRNIGCDHYYTGDQRFFMELHIACIECRSTEIQTKKKKTASRIQNKSANHYNRDMRLHQLVYLPLQPITILKSDIQTPCIIRVRAN